jgi:hypothetical protein
MSSSPYRPRLDGRIVICDYNALLLSVTGLLRMAGYCVFQAYDGHAAEELCGGLPNISLLILNTSNAGSAASRNGFVPAKRFCRPWPP